MGFTVQSLNLINQISHDLRDSSILSLGNPFLSDHVLNLSNISYIYKKNIKSIDRNNRAKYLFEQVFASSKFSILDISDEECADVIWDLNVPISSSTSNCKYDYVLDFGTQEHVFDNKRFLENAFQLLRVGGSYIFVLPSNGEIDHGFRQYSPTFFYDLCAANIHHLSVEHLALCSKNFSLNVLPMYERMDHMSSSVIGRTHFYEGLSEDNGIFTGTSIGLINRLNFPISLLGVIRKIKEGKLNFIVSQCLYRNNTLGQVLPDPNKGLFNMKSLFVSVSKKIALNFPLPAALKLHIFSFLASRRN